MLQINKNHIELFLQSDLKVADPDSGSVINVS